MGDGHTSIAREITYYLLKQKYPVRRNLEAPETEFSLPLTVLGYPRYPTNIFEWLEVLTKNYLNLKRIGAYKHFLVLELNFIDPEILTYWLKLLSPETALIVESLPIDYSEFVFKKVVKISSTSNERVLGPYKLAAEQIGRFYKLEKKEIASALKNFSLPQSKIRYFPGKNGSTIIDATHHYFPIKLDAVLEITNPQDDSSQTVVFTNQKADLRILKKYPAEVNPRNYEPDSADTIIIRGKRTEKLPELENLFTTNRPLF
jgi:hypothetical protein